MQQSERQKCREAFDRYDPQSHGVVDIWRIRDLMKAVDISATDEELFLILPEAEQNKSQTISFNDFIGIVQKYKSTGQSTDMDPDLMSAWQFSGGNADKSGKVQIKKLQAAADKFSFQVKIEKILESYQLRKLAQKISSQNKKIQMPEEIDFEDFTNVFGNDGVEKLPSWILQE
ncbi:Dynein_light chain [Hexamita inflata]|uniref:Dynein light chain n=1 Tax=Hexamita inflata TaxID=28002 RepID=A0AA86R3R6_9EUKA|nr:Dynein light chain [Hexamita inflata]CAI9971116.1 Dynein light chain [Hexamita inflata]